MNDWFVDNGYYKYWLTSLQLWYKYVHSANVFANVLKFGPKFVYLIKDQLRTEPETLHHFAEPHASSISLNSQKDNVGRH